MQTNPTDIIKNLNSEIIEPLNALTRRDDLPLHHADSLRRINARIEALRESLSVLFAKDISGDRLINLLTELNPRLTPDMIPEHTDRDAGFVLKAAKIISDNISEQFLDIAFIQNHLNMSHSTLYRKVKQLTTMSANEFIRRLRIRNSASLLREGYSVAEAAYSSGFNDLGYFRNCFRDQYGTSPSAYASRKPERG